MRRGNALPASLVLAGAVSVQTGAGIANHLFSQIPPASVTTLRLWAGALSTGLRHVLANGEVFPVRDAVTLAVWAVISITLAARYFRWE